jgi:ribonuclease P protein component
VGTHLATDRSSRAEAPAFGTVWLGTVLPKRHARRAVTRSLLKRQIRAAVGIHVESLAAGRWVVRLRSSFDRAAYPSAASTALQHDARIELDDLLLRCSQDYSPRGAAADAPRTGR